MRQNKCLLILTLFFIAFLFISCDNKEDGKLKLEVFDSEQKTLYSDTISFTSDDTLRTILLNTEDLKAEGEDSTYGFYLTSLCGLKGDNNYYWSFSVNDEYSLVGIDGVKLLDGMKITFNYEKIEYN